MSAKKRWLRWWVLALLIISLILILISSLPQNRKQVVLPLPAIVVTVSGEYQP